MQIFKDKNTLTLQMVKTTVKQNCRSCLHKVHTSIGGRKDRRTDGRMDGKPKTMFLRFSSKRRGTITVNSNFRNY